MYFKAACGLCSMPIKAPHEWNARLNLQLSTGSLIDSFASFPHIQLLGLSIKLTKLDTYVHDLSNHYSATDLPPLPLSSLFENQHTMECAAVPDFHQKGQMTTFNPHLAVVDNVPKVNSEKLDKLMGILNKIFSQLGNIREGTSLSPLVFNGSHVVDYNCSKICNTDLLLDCYVEPRKAGKGKVTQFSQRCREVPFGLL